MLYLATARCVNGHTLTVDCGLVAGVAGVRRRRTLTAACVVRAGAVGAPPRDSWALARARAPCFAAGFVPGLKVEAQAAEE